MEKRIYTSEEIAALGMVLVSYRAAYRTQEEAQSILDRYSDEHQPFMVLFDEGANRFGVCDERDLEAEAQD